jgi:hypothetical protein
MELEEFVKKVLIDLNSAVDEANDVTKRTVRFTENEKNLTIEFDIAVSAESKNATTGKAGIKVWSIAEGGGSTGKESKNSIVSRVKFGLRVNPETREEEQARRQTRQTKSGNIASTWQRGF